MVWWLRWTFFFFHTRLHLVQMLSKVRHWRDRLGMVFGGVEVVQKMREDVVMISDLLFRDSSLVSSMLDLAK